MQPDVCRNSPEMKVSRRACLRILAVGVGGMAIAACAPPTAAPTAAPPATLQPTPVAVAPTQPLPPVAAATAATATPVPKPAAPTEWVVGLNQEPNVLDPAGPLMNLPAGMLSYHLFDTLTTYIALRYAPGFTLVPRLAEAWSLIDQQTWELKLRQGVKWHTGDNFTADDVKYTFDTYLDPTSVRTLRNVIQSVDVVNPTTVRIGTKGPQAGFFQQLAGTHILPRRVREQTGADGFEAHPVGTGPYQFVERVRGQRVTIRANPTYWGGPVDGPAQLMFRGIPDATTRVAELRTRGAHIILAPPIAQLQELQTAETEVVPLKGARAVHYRFNTTKKPFDDVRVRQAANYAVDRQAIIKSVLGGAAEPLHGPFSSAWIGYDPSLRPYAYDPAKAKQLLADAGYGGGLDSIMNIGTTGAVLKEQDIAEVLTTQLGEVGIRLQIVRSEDAKIDQSADEGTMDGILQDTWGASADPDSMITTVFGRTKLLAPDQRLADLLQATKSELDPQRRVIALQTFGRYAHEQSLWLFVHAQDDFWAKRTEVGWQPYPVSGTFSRVLFYRPA